ncbi:MAG TPA: DUF4118 domain-containing protein [Terriglobales bacterium]|nr:DUF4118 domain-containing protein [Terriglobales bacterium]
MPAWLRPSMLVAVSLALATVLTFPLRNVTSHSLSMLFFAAVVITSRFGGTRPGIVTALLSVVIFDWFFDTRPYHLDLNLAGLLRAVMFLCVCLLVAGLEKQRRAALHSLEGTNRELQAALEEVRVLRGILPICMHCKQIRNDEGAWIQLEEYIREHSEAEFSHGVCPECFRKHYPEAYQAAQARATGSSD